MKYVNVTGPDINNGNGCRATIWFAGCTHNCKGCHNSWLQNYNLGNDISNLYNDISSRFDNASYYDGITLSGGDPLANSKNSLNELYSFIKWFKDKYSDKNIWIYTGYTLEELLNEKDTEIGQIRLNVIKECDVLVDGPFIEELKDLSLPFRGSSNQRIIDINLNKFHW